MEEIDYNNLQSRNEKILATIIQKYEGDLEDPQSRIEVLLMELNDYIGQLIENSGGTPDWTVTDESADGFIKNKPAIKSGTGNNSILEGQAKTSSYEACHAEGIDTEATFIAAHAEGHETKASGQYSHAEGGWSVASEIYAHAEGCSKATARNSHAECQSTASGYYSHSEGLGTASGYGSHAEGIHTTASGSGSHAQGIRTSATKNCQFVFGACNIEDPSESTGLRNGTYIEIVGNGTFDGTYWPKKRSNARTLDWDGNEWLAGKLTVGADPSEDMDVVTKKYLEEQIAELQKKIDALTPAEESGGDSTTESGS